MDTARVEQDVPDLLSRIDSFLGTPFEPAFSEVDTLSSRRAHIKGYISALEEIQSDLVEQTQHKAGSAIPHPGDVQHKTDMQAIPLRTCALKSQLNALAPISRLPTEILRLIIAFQTHHFIEPFRLSPASNKHPPADMRERAKATHVCRKWRDVALGDPVLWSCIPSPAQPEWALEMLARSRDAPLAFTADYFGLSYWGQVAARKILRQMSRIRELSLAVPEPAVVGAELMRPAPALKSFAIRVYRELRLQELAQPLFRGIAPKLRHMSLDKCTIPWDSRLFNGLTVLRLANLNLPHDITPAQFLDIFRRIPNLHALRIMDVEFDSRHAPYAPPHARLVLHNLNFLTLSGSASLCRFVLTHADLPKNPSMYLAFSLRREHILQAPARIIDALPRLLAGTDRPFRHLTIEGPSKTSLRVEASLTEYRTRGAPHAAPPRAHFTFRAATDIQANYELVAALPPVLLACLPAGRLRTLLLKGWGACTACRAGVPALSAVDSIILHGRAAGEWLAHVNGPVGAGALPGLRGVVFWGAVFKQEESALFDMLMAFLRSERAGCAAVEVLEFRDCVGLEPAQVVRLQRRVPEIVLYESPQASRPRNYQPRQASTEQDPNRFMISHMR